MEHITLKPSKIERDYARTSGAARQSEEGEREMKQI